MNARFMQAHRRMNARFIFLTRARNSSPSLRFTIAPNPDLDVDSPLQSTLLFPEQFATHHRDTKSTTVSAAYWWRAFRMLWCMRRETGN